MHQPRLESWLKRRIWRQAQGNVLVGLASALGSIVVLALTLYFTFFVLLWIGMHIFALLELLGWRTPSIFSCRPWLFVGAGFFLVLLFIGNAATDREDLERLPRVTWTSRMAGEIIGGAAKLITDLLFTGPRLVMATYNFFGKAFRLARFDFRFGAEVLAILASRDSRVSFREICDRVVGINPVRIFPQFGDVDGVVFLTRDPAGLSLTAELRAELRSAIGSVEAREEGRSDGPEVGSSPRLYRVRPNCYAILGIESSASLEEARSAYRRLMKEHHPDRVAGLGDELRELAEEHAKQINKAYEDVCAILQQETQQV